MTQLYYIKQLALLSDRHFKANDFINTIKVVGAISLKNMSISVILPTANFSSGIQRLLSAIKSQTAELLEIIVIDSSSNGDSADIARALGVKVVVIPAEEFNHGGTRSLGAKIAHGDVLIFLTQDVVLADSTAFEKIASVFVDSQVGAAYGRQLPHEDADIFGRVLRAFNYSGSSYVRVLKDREKYGIKTAFLSNSFAAYSRKALESIGWFKDGLILGEDTYAGAKLLMSGYRVAYAADSIVRHSHNYTPWQDFSRYFDIGVFHTREEWIITTFGKAEGEGLKFLLSSVKFFKDNRALIKVPEFFLRAALKFIGYRLGRWYSLLPLKLCERLSMNSAWWNPNIATPKYRCQK